MNTNRVVGGLFKETDPNKSNALGGNRVTSTPCTISKIKHRPVLEQCFFRLVQKAAVAMRNPVWVQLQSALRHSNGSTRAWSKAEVTIAICSESTVYLSPLLMPLAKARDPFL